MQGSILLQSQLIGFADAKPDAPCLGDTQTDTWLTYSQVTQAMFRVRQLFGDEPGTIILALPSGLANAISWLAALCGGHTLVPVSPQLTASEFKQTIDKHRPTIVIVETDDITVGAAHRITLAEIQAIINTRLAFDKTTIRPEALEGSVFLSTSGSTGKPKGMILSASQCTLTAGYIIESHKLTENDRGLTPLPFFHVNAPIVSLLSTVLSGGSLVIAPKYSTSNFWHWIEQYNPTWISLVPAMLIMLLSTERPAFLDTANLRFVRTASAHLAETNLRAFEAQFKLPVIETYGISEAASTITANPVPPGVHKPGSVGLPIGVTMQLFEPGSETAVSVGTVGEVCIKGQNVINAYEAGAGQDSFAGDWFRTGDLGYFDEDGYLFLTSRIKDIIVRGGENIFPVEIEDALREHASILDAVVVGAPDPIYGEQVAAFIILNEHVSTSSTLTKDIQNFLGQRLSRQKLPQQLVVLDALPKTATGKVDKQPLREQAAHVVTEA